MSTKKTDQTTYLEIDDTPRLTFDESVNLTVASLLEYGLRFRHWVVSYSGGKDSTALVTLLHWLLREQRIPTPKTLTVMYADTRRELPPLDYAARAMLWHLGQHGMQTQIVTAPLDKRFYVTMLGRGVSPPNNRRNRWCTRQLKAAPMSEAKWELYRQIGEPFLNLTGVRLGESAVRDATIAKSCSVDGGECGQGWYHNSEGPEIGASLAPILHWRFCHVADWLSLYAPHYGYDTEIVVDTYGFAQSEEQADQINLRTGCMGCELITRDGKRDPALEYLISKQEWFYLAPFRILGRVSAELIKPQNRLRKQAERKRDGTLAANPDRYGPAIPEARIWALDTILEQQYRVNKHAKELGRPEVALINAEEEARIRELATSAWPERWYGNEPRGDTLIPITYDENTTQEPLLVLPAMEWQRPQLEVE